jgi:hypothetical protein
MTEYANRITHAYFASFTKKNGLKQYIIPGSYAYLKKTALNRVYIMSDAGLFIAEQDSLRKLY